MVKKILAIDGGGMYGVVAAQACIQIEEAMGGKKLKDIFDLFVGTSTGALICSTALKGNVPNSSEQGLKAEEIKQKYYDEKHNIFIKNPNNGEIGGVNLNAPAYIGRDRDVPLDIRTARPENQRSGLALDGSLRRILGKWRMAQLSNHSELISISAYNVSKGETRFFRSWRNEDRDIYLHDAVAASSSGPTKHPMYEINGDCHADGGLFAEDPSLFALGDAMKLWPNDSYVIVSLGTGKKSISYDCNDIRQKDDIWWAKNISNIFLDGQHESIEEVISKLDQKALWLKYFRFNIDLDGITDENGDSIKRKRADEFDDVVLGNAESKMAKYLDGNNQFKTMIESLKKAELS